MPIWASDSCEQTHSMRSAIFRTPITELFGIRHPIVCGGLVWLADARYVAAVVNAGGMGFITASTYPDPVRFREELQLAKELTKGASFGVNFGISQRDSTVDKFDQHRKIVCEEGIRFIETSGSSPAAILPQLHEAGIKVMHKAPTVRYGETAAKLGVDAVCIIGAESAGHPGMAMVGTMVQAALAPQRIKVPLVVGGGIGTGAQLAAIILMGGDAALLGSRMLVASEIPAHPTYKRRIVKGDGTDSKVVMHTFNHNHRVMENESSRAVAKLERELVDDFGQYEPHVLGTIVRDAYTSGDLSRGMIDYGQGVVFANEVMSVEAIFDQILDEAVAAVATFKSRLVIRGNLS